LPDASAGGLPVLVVAAREDCGAVLAKADAARNARLAELTKRYAAALTRLMKKLTAEEKLDLAMSVKQEKERAEFILADASSKLPGRKPVAAAVPAVPVTRSVPAVPSLPTSLKRGLVLYYGFDKDEGDDVKDSSGRGNHGIVSGATWTGKGVTTGAYRFDGKDDRIRIDSPRHLASVDDFTVAVWLRAETWGDRKSRGVICKKPRRAGGFVLYNDGHHQPKLNLRARGKLGNADYVPSLNDVETGAWQHWAVVCDSRARTCTLYSDGESDKRYHRFAVGRIEDDGPLYIGHAQTWNGFFHGLIDEVMIWNRALSESEVKQVYELTGGK